MTAGRPDQGQPRPPLDEGAALRALVEGTATETGEAEVRTVRELEALERENLRRALQKTGWKVAGEQGAARLLGMHPNTLASRMKSLGIARPRR